MNITSPDTKRLLAEATDWRMLGLLFSCPGPGWQDQLDAIAASTDDEHLRRAVAAARDEAGSTVYHTVFGPGGPAAAREVSYQRSSFTGRFLAELQDAYTAFAYESSTGETPDHVATQADFVGYLRLKEAYARARGDLEQAELTARAAERIITDHLVLIAEPLAETLRVSGLRYLALTATALEERVGRAPQRAAEAAPDIESLVPLDPRGYEHDSQEGCGL